MNVNISDESWKFLKEFMNRINTQDNRATAKPYYYVVQCKREIAVAEGTNGNSKYYDNQSENSYTLEELRKIWFEENKLDELDEHESKEWEQHENKEWTEEIEDEFQEYIDKNCQKYDVDEIDVDENVFFTKQGYKDHIKLNGHNYSHYNKFNSYIKHAFRNPELNGLFKALEEITENVPKENN